MNKTTIRTGRKMWIWFVLLSMLTGLIVALHSGSLQTMQNIRTAAPLNSFKAHMERRIPALMKQYQIPGCSIALVRDYKIVWTEGFGYADVQSRRPLTADTPMSVQSITKSLTAWGVMTLAEKGLVDLDAPLSRYLTSWQFPQPDSRAERITIRRLLSHTAGMPLGDFTDVYTPGDNMPSLRDKLTKEAVFIREPGAIFSYSNVGYHLLELLIEELSGESFESYMRSNVFAPLGMKTATFCVDRTITPYPPTGYDLGGRPVSVYVYPEKASGGLFATAEDIARFAVAGMNKNPVLTAESIRRMYQPESLKIGVYGLVFNAYGLGHYIEMLPNGFLSVSHGGQGNGIMTHFQAVPETGDAIVILTNSQRSWPFIAYLLSDWARWRAFPSVGMSKILFGQYGLSAVIGVLLSASLLMVLQMVLAICPQNRASFRLVRVGLSLLLLGALIWCSCQEYLFISSVFPVLAVWLAGAVLIFSLVLLISVFMPCIRREKGVP
jgi:CubicO group peptidase (beta-lactamase class C family)